MATRAITCPIFGLASGSARDFAIFAWLRPAGPRLTPLTIPSGERRPRQRRDGTAGPWPIGHRARFDGTKGRKRLMNITSITPSIVVTIGRQTRIYYAYITTAPAGLDAPATMTL